MFEAIKVLLHPRRAARTIKARDEDIVRIEGQYERAVASRVAGTYRKAYDEGFAQGRELGVQEGIARERARLQQLGIQIPRD